MSSDASKKDNSSADPNSTVPATKGDVTSIFTAINAIAEKVDAFKTSTSDLINGVTDHITTLEKDLADGSTTGDHSDNIATGLSSLFKSHVSSPVLSSPLHSPASAKHHFDSDDDDADSKKPKKKKFKKKRKVTPSSSDSQSDSEPEQLDPFMQEIMQECEVTKP